LKDGSDSRQSIFIKAFCSDFESVEEVILSSFCFAVAVAIYFDDSQQAKELQGLSGTGVGVAAYSVVEESNFGWNGDVSTWKSSDATSDHEEEGELGVLQHMHPGVQNEPSWQSGQGILEAWHFIELELPLGPSFGKEIAILKVTSFAR
jgi:hypothetical protein